MARRPQAKSRGKEANLLVQSAAECITWNRENPGRPAKYHDGFCYIAEQCCIINADSPQLAEMFCCNSTTLLNWQTEHPEFLIAIKRGKAKTDEEVERALVHRAKGYSHRAHKIYYNEQGGVVAVPYEEHFAPDTGAIAFWLKNRKPEQWRDRKEGDNGSSPEETKALLRDELRKLENSTDGEVHDEGDEHGVE